MTDSSTFQGCRALITSGLDFIGATLSAVLDRLSLSGVDWFKTDSQGTDLRLFQSLPDDLRSRVLAVDIEPGLIDAYQGEDLFIDAHREMTRQGFWLSNLSIGGAVRMRRSTLDELAPESAALIQLLQRPSPAWSEARYLRTVEWLTDHQMPAHRYALLWVFAILDEQYGFALDVALEYNRAFGKNAVFSLLWEAPLRQVQRCTSKTAWASFKSMVPAPLKQFIRRLL